MPAVVRLDIRGMVIYKQTLTNSTSFRALTACSARQRQRDRDRETYWMTARCVTWISACGGRISAVVMQMWTRVRRIQQI